MEQELYIQQLGITLESVSLKIQLQTSGQAE